MNYYMWASANSGTLYVGPEDTVPSHAVLLARSAHVHRLCKHAACLGREMADGSHAVPGVQEAHLKPTPDEVLEATLGAFLEFAIRLRAEAPGSAEVPKGFYQTIASSWSEEDVPPSRRGD